MAILEEYTDNFYYKIDPNKSKQEDNLITIFVDVYENIDERNKEKERLDKIFSFNSNIDLYFKNRFSIFAEEQEIDEALINFYYLTEKIKESYYKLPGGNPKLNILPEQLIVLRENGFEEIWITDPIGKMYSQELYFYDEINLHTTEDYYNFLKTKMNNSIKDV